MCAANGNQLDLQPHNVQAEEATLGALLIDPDAVLSVRETLRARDFYIGKNQYVYGAYLAAIDGGNEAPTYVEICDILERQGKLEEVGGAAYITSLINKTPSALNVAHYARIVAETGYQRRVIAAAQKIAQIGYAVDEMTVDERQETIERVVFDLAPVRAGEGLEPISVAVSQVYDDVDRRYKGQIAQGVKTGFARLDKMTGGLQKSDLIIIAARPSMGKTALMLDIARNAAKMHHKSVAFFSLEMSKAQIVQRLIASQSDITTDKLRTGSLDEPDWPVFIHVTGELDRAKIYINDRAAQSASQMSADLRRLLAQTEIDLIVIDYLQLMTTNRRLSSTYEIASQLSRDSKALAKEFDLPVVIGSQLSRACEQRADKRPILSDLRDSGKIEEDADIVMFIYRDEYYNEKTDDPNIAEINVAKYRNGPTGMFPLFFKKTASTFRDLQIHERPL